MLSQGWSKYRHNGFKGYIRGDYACAAFIDFLNELDGRIGDIEEEHYRGFEALTDRMVTTVEAPLPAGMRKVILKQDDFTRAPNLFKTLKYMFKPTRGMRGWWVSNLMELSGLPVPAPIAYVERRRAGVFIKGYFLMEYIEGGRSLVDALKGCVAQGDEAGCRALAKHAGRLVRTLHDEGFAHGDMKGTNLLVTGSANGWEIFILDYEDVSYRAHVGRGRRKKDLARLTRSVSVVGNEAAASILKGYGEL